VQPNASKILFVINQLFKGGAETVLISLLNRLVEKNVELTLIVFDQEEIDGTISLLPLLPKQVKLLTGRRNRFAALRTPGAYYAPELLSFLEKQEFDLAISYGEWFSPELVMKYARAKRKALWIHSDITQSPWVKPNELFAWDPDIDFYLCVSESFRKVTVKQFPFLASRTRVVHNCCDLAEIKRLAEEPVSPRYSSDLPLILSVGNLRPEKNYLRAIAAARILHSHGLRFHWVCVGAPSCKKTVTELSRTVQAAGVESVLEFPGAVANSYALMRRAAVLVSCSDHESWSMVITEAKALALPVVATKTTGALEQLNDGHNGLLCDFSAEDLAEKLTCYLTSPKLRKQLRNNLQNAPEEYRSEDELLALLQTPAAAPRRRRLLYLLDDANYQGGAHAASGLLLQQLQAKGILVEVFSGVAPTVATRSRFFPVRLSALATGHERGSWEAISFRDCLFSKKFTIREKYDKFCQALSKRLPGKPKEWEAQSVKRLIKYFSQYDRVCVMSEGSVFRDLVAAAPIPHRFQCIHTNYCVWSKLNDYIKKLTRDDAWRFAKMEKILLVSQQNRTAFAEQFPELADRSVAIRNLIKLPPSGQPPRTRHPFPQLLTVARLEWEKDVPRMIRLAIRLRQTGIRFDWRILGDSAAFDTLCRQVREAGIADCFHVEGHCDNPFPAYREADLFLLLSHYEGLPNTIYESLLSETPVFATRVGGVAEQITDGVTGVLVPDDEEAIFTALRQLLSDESRLRQLQENVKGYSYDNDAVLSEYLNYFGLES